MRASIRVIASTTFLLICLPIVAVAEPHTRHFSNLVAPEHEFGSYGSGATELNTPLAVILHANRIYIADHKNHRVQVRDRAGEHLFNIGNQGSEKGQLNFPSALAVASDELVVADKGNSRIQFFSLDGAFRSEVVLRDLDGSTISPYYLDADNEAIFVIPYDDPRLFIVEKNRTPREIKLPTQIDGLPFDVGGVKTVGEHLLITDAASGRLAVFGRDGRLLRTERQWGSHPGLLASPGGMATSDKQLFIADQINHRIQVFSLGDLSFAFQWGRHPVSGHEGGGRLHYPGSIAVDQSGSLAVVCEPIEHRCQTFDLADIENKPVQFVSETAWWEKQGRFHYGSRLRAMPTALIITEQDTHAVLAFDLRGDTPRLIRKFGGFGTEFGKYVMPSGPFIDEATSTITISDRGNNRVQQYSLIQPAGLDLAAAIEQTRVIDLKEVFSSMQGVPADYNLARVDPGPEIKLPSGERLIVDVAQGAFLFVNDDFRPTRPPILLPKSKSGSHRKPVSAEIAPDGKHVFFVDPWAYQVVKVDLDGKEIDSWGGPGPGNDQFLFPFGLTFDEDGNLFISDTGKHTIKKFDQAGKFILEFGSYGTGAGQFYKPKGLSYESGKHRLYVMDFGNHRAQVFDKNGNFLFTFGIGEQYVPAAPAAPVYRPLVAMATSAPVQGATTTTARVQTVDGQITLELDLPLREITANQPVDFRVKVFQSGKNITNDASVRISANMPLHGHGLPERADVSKSPESISVNQVRFSMPGDWQLEFYVGLDGVWRRAFANVSVN